MIWKASIVLSLAFCVFSASIGDRRYAVSEQKVVLRFSAQHGEMKHSGLQKRENHGEYAKAYPSYEFSYKVDDPHTHDKKAQHEERDGSKVTGNYWLIQPDGEKRYIKYYVDDKSGFNAVINYTSPHSSVYYKRKKHHEEAGNNESEDEKGNENLEDARQEGEENTNEVKDEGKETEINNDQLIEGEAEKVTDDTGNVSNEENSRQEDSRPEEGDEKQQEEGPQPIQEGERSDEQEVSQVENQGNEPENERNSDDGNDAPQEVSIDVNPGVDTNQNEGANEEPRDREIAQDNEQSKENNSDSNQNEEEPTKGKKENVHDLWARFPSFTIIHDYPKEHIKPVWERNNDPEYYAWSGVQSWKGNNPKGGCRNSKETDSKEKSEKVSSGEEEPKLDVEKKAIEEKGDEEVIQSKEEVKNNVEEKGSETQKDSKKLPEVADKVDRSWRGRGEGRRISKQRRGGEERRGERRSGSQGRQEGIESRETKRQLGGEIRANDYRRGRSSHQVKFTPIPYGQRY